MDTPIEIRPLTLLFGKNGSGKSSFLKALRFLGQNLTSKALHKSIFQLGEEVFLGLSVPFEVKALIILALGKLFEPVLDQLGIEFQNVVNHVDDIKERYFSRIQIENSKNLLKQIGGGTPLAKPDFSIKDLENYKILLEQSLHLSELIQKNFNSIHSVIEKLNQTQSISAEKIEQLKTLANSITQASNSLGDEKTLLGLKHLEAIVVKK